MAEMLSRLDEAGFPWRGGFGLLPDVRVEDFVEDRVYVLRAELPGLDPEKDLDVYVEDGVLVVQGERREEQRDKNHQEFHYGTFERAVRLPDGFDEEGVAATYDDGVLEVRVPLGEPAKAAPRRKVAIDRPTG
jgi:HSP20 family molecular chaperone IbpA